jgi:hypothetical protein
MSRGWSAAAVSVPLVAILLGFVTEQVANLGGVQCDVWCGPGPQALPFGWMIATGACWLLGLCLCVAGLVTSHARSGAAWLGVAVSTVLPLAVVYLATHPASGS